MILLIAAVVVLIGCLVGIMALRDEGKYQSLITWLYLISDMAAFIVVVCVIGLWIRSK